MTRMLTRSMLVALCLTAALATQARSDEWPAPQYNSSLYPCPVPYVPREVGWTVITNQAFAPHEMLYAHEYRALYGPYYYRTCLGSCCIPFLPKPRLQGTMVTVKYKTNLPWGYCPPWRATKTCFSNTQFK